MSKFVDDIVAKLAVKSFNKAVRDGAFTGLTGDRTKLKKMIAVLREMNKPSNEGK